MVLQRSGLGMESSIEYLGTEKRNRLRKFGSKESYMASGVEKQSWDYQEAYGVSTAILEER